MAEIEHKEIKLTVPWGHIAAKTYGPSNGERVLLVHGHLDNAGSYDRLMKYLPRSFFYYVCVDLPGHGWSSHFPSWIMLDGMDYVHTIHFILEALQWKTCIYIGHSIGAQIGLIFSVFQPHRIKKIIALDGFIVNHDNRPNIITYLENASALSIKASNNIEPVSYTKEEILYALKSLRFASLNSEAADALFERAVTEVNGKYIYNRDIRLKINLMFISLEMANEINRRLSVPIYVFAASKGFINEHENAFASTIKIINSKTKLEIIKIEGNHDFHNNNPERVAPFIRKILTTNNFSKL